MIAQGIGVLLILGALYGALEAWPLIAGPSLTLSTPIPYESSPNGLVVVQGVARRTARLTLNGSDLVHDQQGAFSSMLALPRGTSILTLEAQDRFGKRTHLTRTVVVPYLWRP
jgi:hypothetical protein